MIKYAVVLQYKEDCPGNPGWWRYSRPCLRHLVLAEMPELTDSVQLHYVNGCQEARRLQKEWDNKYPS